MPNRRRRRKASPQQDRKQPAEERIVTSEPSVAVPPEAAPPEPENAPAGKRQPSKWRRWLKSPGGIAIGVGFPLLMVVVSPLVIGLGSEVVQVPAVRDSVRAKVKDTDDFRYTIRYEDPGYEVILPKGVNLTAKQAAYLRSWNYANVNDQTYTLRMLLEELRRAGAATPAQEMNIVVTAEGQRHQPLHVDAIYPVEIHRTAPYAGTFVLIPPQDGGSNLQMLFNFDDPSPSARVVIGGNGLPLKSGPPYFQKYKLTIKDGREDTINIATISTRYAATFKIRIDYRIGEESRHRIIDDGGRPFAVTPINCVDRAPRGKNGEALIGKNGKYIESHVSYDHVWELGNNGIAEVKNPRRWPASTYC